MAARLCKITGSRLKDIVVKRGAGKKKGFYELIAERLTIQSDIQETPLEHGHRCEPEAIERFEQKMGKKVDTSLVIWARDEDENIAVSPDGSVIGSDNTEAVEVKALSSANHLEAYLTKQIPKEYEEQKIQYFVVNDKLEKLHFCFYDPRLKVADFFIITVTRAEVLGEIEAMLIYQRETLKEVNEIVDSLLTI